MRIKFYTFGCKVNQYETQAIMEEFIKNNYIIADKDIDLYIVNTCSVTKRADSKSIRLIKSIKRKNPDSKIAAIGCLAELNSDILKKIGADYIIPQREKHLTFEILSSKKDLNNKNIWSLNISKFLNQRAFLKIQDGCNFKCSFCKIPYLRGQSASRDRKDILEELNRLLENNYKEIVLCGINLGLYGRDLNPKLTLEDLVEDILKINFDFRIRLSSIEPVLITDRLILLFKNPKICPHIHLPFQSGDDYILEKMNKKETVSLYKDIVEKFRKINPNIAISCDIMIGFPYETDETFKNTIEFLEFIMPMRIHIFSFSPREKTEFSNYKIKDNRKIFQRYNILKKLADRLAFEYKSKFINKSLNMLAEERFNSYTLGYTENYIRVITGGNLKLGNIFPVTIYKIDKDKVFAKSLI